MIITSKKRLGCALASVALVSIPLSALGAFSASADTTGSATAQGVSVNLNASLAGTAVVNASAVIGNVASPPSTSQTALSLSGAGGLGTTSAGVVNVSATTTGSSSEGSAQITGLNYSLLGTPLLQGNGNVISADATCPTSGQPTATTNLAGLQVLGQAVSASANTPAVTVSSAVSTLPPIVGLTSATLNATVSSTTHTTATSASAIAVNVNVTMTATILGSTTTVPVGNIILASVTCNSATVSAGATGTTGTTGTTGAAGTTGATGTTTPPASGTTVPASGSGAASSTASTGTGTPVASPSNGSSPIAQSPAPTAASSSAPTPGSPVFAATTTHTGEPWAGSEPYVVALLALGGALIGLGELARRRSRRAAMHGFLR